MQAPCRRTLDQSTKNIFKFSYARDLVGIVSKGTNILSLQGIVLNVAFDSGQLEVQVSKLFKYMPNGVWTWFLEWFIALKLAMS